MRIQKINNNYSINNNAKSFKGYVNGKYYDDSIINLAKKALKNSNWEKEFRAGRSNLKAYANWHENIEDQGGLATRILGGILSLGTSELLVGGICLLGAALDDTNKTVNEVKDCMIDMLSDGGKGK